MKIMPYENVIPLSFSRASEGNTASIAAPGAGKRIAIDFLHVHPSGGANVITLNGKISVSYQLDDNQEIMLQGSATDLPEGIFPCGDNQAFTLVQNLPLQVEGYLLYRITG